MKSHHFEPLLRDVTIKAIDGISRKFNDAESAAGKAVKTLLKRWNDLDPMEKETVIGIVIATAATAVSAISTKKGRRKKVLKKAGKSVVKKVASRLV